ncbi:MAG TPA: hypothetical protein ENN40_10270 [Candidatus Aminicenantes bacterium]|nr:hypothetical protein [Candidatus Aminicenantes bacterium]
MKKTLLVAVLILGFGRYLPGVFPDFYGARSLSLGHSVFASGWDVSAIYLNPAALAEVQAALSAYQFQQSYRDYLGFEDSLGSVLAKDLAGFLSMDPAEKRETVQGLKQLWSLEHGISGSTARMPALVSRNFGFSLAWIRAGRMQPAASSIFDVPAEAWGSEELNALRMRFFGLDYRQFSLAYALDLTREIRLGVGLHYLTGRGSVFDTHLMAEPFGQDVGIRDLAAHAWGQAQDKFNRILADLSLVMNMGQTFQGILMVKNLGNPEVKLESATLKLPQQVIAGLAFRPSRRLAIYLNMDLKPTDMWFDGRKVQPISLGMETAFYQQRIFLRAGIWNDLQEKYFLGNRSNVQYGFGLGFRMNRLVLDVGMALNASGSVAGLAVGAAVWVQ